MILSSVVVGRLAVIGRVFAIQATSAAKAVPGHIADIHARLSQPQQLLRPPPQLQPQLLQQLPLPPLAHQRLPQCIHVMVILMIVTLVLVVADQSATAGDACAILAMFVPEAVAGRIAIIHVRVPQLEKPPSQQPLQARPRLLRRCTHVLVILMAATDSMAVASSLGVIGHASVTMATLALVVVLGHTTVMHASGQQPAARRPCLNASIVTGRTGPTAALTVLARGRGFATGARARCIAVAVSVSPRRQLAGMSAPTVRGRSGQNGLPVTA